MTPDHSELKIEKSEGEKNVKIVFTSASRTNGDFTLVHNVMFLIT